MPDRLTRVPPESRAPEVRCAACGYPLYRQDDVFEDEHGLYYCTFDTTASERARSYKLPWTITGEGVETHTAVYGYGSTRAPSVQVVRDDYRHIYRAHTLRELKRSLEDAGLTVKVAP